jgi:hypothetical protein
MIFNMKQINSFVECVRYVHYLGAVSKPKDYSIAHYQTDLCVVCDRINVAAGNSTWYFEEFKSFYIRYTRKDKTFTVIHGPAVNTVTV